ncbi:hypothetical protein JCM10212_000977 [Sporobolomyces blumeae]
MALIAHRQQQAVWKLELAVAKDSSSACRTLANLYAKGYCSQSPEAAAVSPLANSVSPTSPPATNRPRFPERAPSWNCHHHHPAAHKSPEAIKAAALFVRGLEIELAKPVEAKAKSKRPRRASLEDTTDEERAEGRYWDLQNALDLVVGITDSHRFGVLHAPAVETSNPASPTSTPDPAYEETNAALWTRSAKAATLVLSHPTIAPLLSDIPSDPTSQQNPASTEAPLLARSSSSRRDASVSRSYTHPAAAIPEPGSNGLPSRKLRLTIAIHALYILALQAFSSPLPSVPAIPTPDASPLLVDSVQVLSASPASAPRRADRSTGTFSGDSPSTAPRTEPGKALSASLFNLILLLCPPSQSIGIKEGDELVGRARMRLDAIRNVDSADDWRLAKKKKSANGTLASSEPGRSVERRTEAESKAERLAMRPNPSPNSRSGHGQERSEPSFTTASSATITQDGAESMSRTPRSKSKFHFANEEEERAGQGQQDYPSPPTTPPAESANLALELDTNVSVSPKRSPPLASPLQPRYLAAHSRSSATLSRHAHRRFSISSGQSSNPSMSSRFRPDPTRSLLRRVESSTSVCTVPPDFGATRLRAGDKGKGRAVDPESLGLGGIKFGRGEMTVPARGHGHGGAALAGVERDRTIGKSWLSRFFSVSGMTTARGHSSANPVATGSELGTNGDAAARLKAALRRDDEAALDHVEYVMDWGDEDEDDEEFEGSDGEAHRDSSRAEDEEETSDPSISTPTTPDLSDPEASRAIRATSKSLPTSPRQATKTSPETRPSLPRRHSSNQSLRTAKSKRSFMLSDPTTVSTPATSSNEPNPTLGYGSFLSPLSAAKRSSASSPPSKKKPGTSIDPLLLELERSSRVGVRTVCQACHKKGLNFPACTTCSKTYCSRTCRVGMKHPCAVEKHQRKAAESSSSSGFSTALNSTPAVSRTATPPATGPATTPPKPAQKGVAVIS